MDDVVEGAALMEQLHQQLRCECGRPQGRGKIERWSVLELRECDRTAPERDAELNPV